ncbi:hypothetical protein ZEAMMB73_Zm00001d037851 [Zea mays]|uniref:DM2 domain-containing protein n=1 Tax=Zea mays TaxID=4577 RepID=A0A1D6M130_MAIZE|nr:hypothetical protein ZEAMMB73_Zm00001d037851 [Zea mays]
MWIIGPSLSGGFILQMVCGSVPEAMSLAASLQYKKTQLCPLLVRRSVCRGFLLPSIRKILFLSPQKCFHSTFGQVNCKEMICSQLVLSGDSITEQPFAPVAAMSHWLTPARNCITTSMFHRACRFAMRKNKFMGSNKNQAKKIDINCDATLKSLFGGRDKVGMLEISKLLSRDFPKISKLLWSMEPGMALW